MSDLMDGGSKEHSPNKKLMMVAGIAAAFFLTPLLYGVTIDFVMDFARQEYGGWIEWFVKPLWFCLDGAGIYFVTTTGGAYLIEHLKFQHSLRSAKNNRFR